jgi:hypothetical protein
MRQEVPDVRISMTSVASVLIVTGVTLAGVTACGLQPAQAGSGPRRAIAPATRVPASAVPTVEATFSSAMRAAASLGSPPAAWEMGIVSALQTGQPVPGFSASMRSDLLAAGEAAIARYFAPPQAAAEQQELIGALARDANPNVINLGSGAGKVAFGVVRVDGSTAVVSAQVTIWAKTLARGPRSGPWQAAAPVRVLSCTATLRLSTSGQWQVTRLTR